MKAKHIITSILLLVLPIILIRVFVELTAHFRSMGFILKYGIQWLGLLTASIPNIAYVFWLSFVIRTKERRIRIIYSICIFISTSFILAITFLFHIFPYSAYSLSTLGISIILANIFAGVYMLVRGKRLDTQKTKEE